MRTFGLIGNPISESLSPSFFQKKFEIEDIEDAVYQLFPLKSITDLPFLIEKEKTLVGLNVTHPYKETVLPYMNQLTPAAQAIGAVNTIRIHRAGGRIALTGHNTDCEGFGLLLDHINTPNPEHALVLGTGGAAKAVAYALAQRNISYTFISRTAGQNRLTYNDITADIIQRNPLIINATPVGMGAECNTCLPLPYSAITPQHILIDLIYRPEVTTFLQKGKAQGASTFNGLPMLIGQAEASWRFWEEKDESYAIASV